MLISLLNNSEKALCLWLSLAADSKFTKRTQLRVFEEHEMGDNRKVGDTQVQEATDKKVAQKPDAAQVESNAGMKDLSQGAKDYTQARKEGMRDPHTQELLPPQPEIIDGSDAKNQAGDLNQPVDAQKAPGVQKDADGRVTSVTYPDGSTNEMIYDKDGNVTQLNARDGSVWKKDDSGEWKRSRDGKPIKDEVGDFKVNEEGEIVAFRKDGSVDAVKHVDGSKTEFGKDGTSQMTTDSHERPTSITYSDGSTNKIKYDKDGNVEQVDTKDGSTWKKDDKGEWKRTKDGKPVDDEVGGFHVTEDGDIIATRKDGTPDMVRHRDGSVTEFSKDGDSQMTKDIDGRPTSITYKDGSTNKIKYDENGNVAEVNTRDGSTWKKDESGEWKRTKNGKPVADEVGDFHVTEDGDIVATRKDGSVDMIKHRDGSTTEYGKDGTSQMTKNMDGRPTSITYPDGGTNKITYDENGKVSQLDARDGTVWKKIEDGEWKRTRDGKPVDDEIGDFHVTEEGDIVATRKDGSVDMIKHKDGSSTEFTEDGKSSMTKDIEGRPTSITYPDGNTNKITYDSDGNPTEIKVPDSTWKKGEDGKWTRYDEKGKVVETSDGDFKVEKNGDLVALKADGTVDEVLHRDGTQG